MMTTSTASERSAVTAPLVEALVLAIEDDRVRVRLSSGERTERLARVALPSYAPAVGDRVLVQQVAETGAVYVTGVLCASRPPSITTPSGASATAEGDVLALRDAAGRVVVTLDGASGELRLAAEGDLRLSAPSGRVLVEAAGDVSLRGASLQINAAEASLAVGRWELRAERIIERSTEVLRTVEGLLETRAKFARLIVTRALELTGRRTTIISEEDTRIDGKRVLLG
jgi:hypothetical protein